MQGSTLRAGLLQVKNIKIAEGQVKIRVCPPHMAGKISCNFRDTKTREIQYFFNNTDKAIAGKQVIGTSKVHVEKSLSFTFYHTFCRAGHNCVGQEEIKVNLPYLESTFKS